MTIITIIVKATSHNHSLSGKVSCVTKTNAYTYSSILVVAQSSLIHKTVSGKKDWIPTM